MSGGIERVLMIVSSCLLCSTVGRGACSKRSWEILSFTVRVDGEDGDSRREDCELMWSMLGATKPRFLGMLKDVICDKSLMASEVQQVFKLWQVIGRELLAKHLYKAMPCE